MVFRYLASSSARDGDEGLAYHISSRAGNDYRDTAMISISLQTKVESAAFALKLVFEEIEKLAKDGPTEEELAMAKKTLVESLPGLFDSPSSTAAIFAGDELLGKSPDHYLDYVKEINAVTAEQVKAMIAKYYAKEKMTISVVQWRGALVMMPTSLNVQEKLLRK